MLLYNSGVRASVTLLEIFPMNAVHEWQYCRLNCQTEVQFFNQGVWDNHERAPAVIGNALQTMIPGVDSVCLGRREFGCRLSPGLLLTDTRPSLAQRQNLLSTEKTTDHSILQ
ncbi:uncharacterized protein TNCV_3367751 [Trichonephila clavipes]|nr:uncharacterized protein TNCV_3367751 [Trichonephila clavipes]